MNASQFYIGIMSGTSLDGVDAVLVEFNGVSLGRIFSWSQSWNLPLRQQLLRLNFPTDNELHIAALTSNGLADNYANAVLQLLQTSGVAAKAVVAIGCHGQTVRHRPEAGYSIQLGNAARLAELTHITVVSDFRSRDIAAGGQGAPLVPAFHHALFHHPAKHRCIVNIGGIANISDLPAQGSVSGFDCGPGNILLDAWVNRHHHTPFDKDGAWAAQGKVIPALLTKLLAHTFFSASPPKSTGRDSFNLPWVEASLQADYRAEDVQATLLQLTVESIAQGIEQVCPNAEEIYLCGGGAYNKELVKKLAQRLPKQRVSVTDDLNVPAQQVEALAFAWLAKQAIEGKPGNLPQVTGAKGLRVLGAIYPA